MGCASYCSRSRALASRGDDPDRRLAAPCVGDDENTPEPVRPDRDPARFVVGRVLDRERVRIPKHGFGIGQDRADAWPG